MKLVISENALLGGHYIEVYAGGAGIAWPLLFEEYVQRVHINDLNEPVYAFWHAVLHTPEELCKLIRDTPVTIDEWNRQKAIQEHAQAHTPLELGFSTFFLNRTNRSGILKGGIIGGKQQKGELKLDARFNKPDLIARIERIARYSKRVSLYNLDAADMVARILPALPNRALVYLDPPYYSKGSDLYEDCYVHKDHVRMARLITRKIKQRWIVSYDAAPKIFELYRGFRSLHYNISYSAQARYSGAEIMFFSHNLILPHVSHPIRGLSSKPNFHGAHAAESPMWAACRHKDSDYGEIESACRYWPSC